MATVRDCLDPTLPIGMLGQTTESSRYSSDRFVRESLQFKHDHRTARLIAFDFCIDLRAKYIRLKTPDALHLAAAILSGCDVFLTNDQRLSVITEIRVETI